jgi:hypothetical protein
MIFFLAQIMGQTSFLDSVCIVYMSVKNIKQMIIFKNLSVFFVNFIFIKYFVNILQRKNGSN